MQILQLTSTHCTMAAANVPYVRVLCEREMITRAVKHVLRGGLMRTGPSFLAARCMCACVCVCNDAYGPFLFAAMYVFCVWVCLCTCVCFICVFVTLNERPKYPQKSPGYLQKNLIFPHLHDEARGPPFLPPWSKLNVGTDFSIFASCAHVLNCLLGRVTDSKADKLKKKKTAASGKSG